MCIFECKRNSNCGERVSVAGPSRKLFSSVLLWLVFFCNSVPKIGRYLSAYTFD